MDARHIPHRFDLLRYDLGNSHVATVRCRDGQAQDCLRFAGDQMCLVQQPSIVWVRNREGKPAELNVVGFDHAITIEFNRGSTQEVRWVRDPHGLWLRLADQG